MATTAPPGALTIALDRISVPDNVRDLDNDHVQALAGSIALQGILVPVVVRPRDDAFELVAGFHRLAAARSLHLPNVPAVIREADTEDADRAVENIARKQLNPYEEARAVGAMLARGLSEDGAAQALGWSKARVTARVKLLNLPRRAQELVGAGVIALSAVDALRAIGGVAPDLLEALVAFVDANDWAAARLAREPGWVLGQAMRDGDVKAFAAYLNRTSTGELESLGLGKKADGLQAEAEKLHRQLDRYAYGSPDLRFTDADVDQARAAGVLIEFEHGAPIIVDRSLYRELVKAALERTVEELRERVAAAAKEKSEQRRLAAPDDDPMTAARRERDRTLRDLADEAHGASLDLGTSLITGLAVVDPGDMDVARFFVYALLGADYDASPYTQAGERIARLAMNGIRLVVSDFRADVTKTRKDGTRGRLRIDYGDAKDSPTAVKWLWRFVDAANTPGELYGRALVVIAAEQYATRMMLPVSQRMSPTRWSSHNDRAAKALKKLAAPHVPASLTQLERAVKRAHAAYNQAERQQRDNGEAA